MLGGEKPAQPCPRQHSAAAAAAVALLPLDAPMARCRLEPLPCLAAAARC